MRFLIYKDAGEARLSQKMRQIWAPQIFNHFHGSCDGWLSCCPSSSVPTLPVPRLLLHLLEMWGTRTPDPAGDRSRRRCKLVEEGEESTERGLSRLKLL